MILCVVKINYYWSFIVFSKLKNKFISGSHRKMNEINNFQPLNQL